MRNSKASGIATTGNSTTRGGKRYNIASFASPSAEKTTDYVLALSFVSRLALSSALSEHFV